MRFLCTADLHLKKKESWRLDVLRWLCQRAASQEYDCILIAGDLFDSKRDIGALAPSVREIFQNHLRSLPVIIVPGNHDEDLQSNSVLGREVYVLAGDNTEYRLENSTVSINVIGVPYQRGVVSSAILDDSLFPSQGGFNLVLTHGSLIDLAHEFITREINEQGEENSFLLYPGDFSANNVDAVILGHWHKASRLAGDGTQFFYPGSAVPNSKQELGPRSFLDLTVEGDEIVDVVNPTISAPNSRFYEKVDLIVTPGYEGRSLEKLEAEITELRSSSQLVLLIEARGFLGQMAETTFKHEMEQICEEHSSKFHGYEIQFNCSHAEGLSRPIVRKFLDKVEQMELDYKLVDAVLGNNETDLAREFQQRIDSNQQEIKRRVIEVSLEAFANRLG